MKVGEKVQVDFSPLRDTSLKGGALKKITIADTDQVLTAMKGASLRGKKVTVRLDRDSAGSARPTAGSSREAR